ncbi:MAG: efflux RND transporter periplasmic adaptor subunit [Candidatus Omnitrophota bacterium]
MIFAFYILNFSSGCTQQKEQSKKNGDVIPVKVVRVELKDIQKTLDYAGDIKAQNEAVVYPKVSGKIIEKIAEEGTSVQRGDLIAYIDRDEVGFTFEKAPVESPLEGIIGRVYVDKGASVTPQSPVALVVDMDQVKVNLDIPEEYLPKITLGQEARISLQAYPNEKFIGTVSKISPVLDSETRTAPIEIRIPNSDHRLKSGMFAKTQLIIEEHKRVPVIMKEAIMGKDPNLYVYRVENKKAFSKNVTVGIRQGPYYEVMQGLQEGDRVVLMGQQRLYEGAAVAIEEENP